MNIDWNFENSYIKLPNIFYSKTFPEIFPNLRVILKNNDLVNLLELTNDDFDNFIINTVKNKNLNSFSQAYAGHQFGHFTILGDGRATILGEHLNSKKKDMTYS